ncbi:GDSL esterase/lipase [Rhynchospora pubera]|uniref:GDSL esterase/lipase n=1 Tax=Rhynchospora pubera TaxID=906938 RepID=A0AAV8CTA8_9POAL|nr:GDSL esterase/lipase [Rhynchospora pubera]
MKPASAMFLVLAFSIALQLGQASPSSLKLGMKETRSILIFGDSTVDPGNNNKLRTSAKANFAPYGMNFYGGQPTGRFCDGRLATDILADKLGIAKSIPAFLDKNLTLEDARTGVSFASASSGYDESTATNSKVLPFSKQIEYLRHYKLHLQMMVGPSEAEKMLNTAIFIVSAGSNDLMKVAIKDSINVSMPDYESYLITSMAKYIKDMHRLGGRRFVLVGVPPVGCLPIVRTFSGADKCVDGLNELAASFNSKLVTQLGVLKKSLGVKTAYLDVFTVMSEAAKYPEKFGLIESLKGCCGTGMLEVGESCRGQSTCKNPSKYMFWDAVHPTEKMYQIIINNVTSGIYRDILY